MNIYIIYGHPNHNGLCYAALEKVRQGFADAGHQIRVTDLYQDNEFDPILRYEDPRELGDLKNDENTRIYRENITWADKLVFIYPIWWASMPALLKGFIDCVFSSGFAYNFKGVFPTGHWGDKSAWIVVVHDTPRILSQLVQRDYGRILQYQILRSMTGIKRVRRTEMAFTKRSNLSQRKKWLEKVYRIARKSR